MFQQVSRFPPSDTYTLPAQFQYKRLAQTLDTGNCFMLSQLAKKDGGLDRNYDYGSGTDMDFGTRLDLTGKQILHNP